MMGIINGEEHGSSSENTLLYVGITILEGSMVQVYKNQLDLTQSMYALLLHYFSLNTMDHAT
jgi:hypothetical protein